MSRKTLVAKLAKVQPVQVLRATWNEVVSIYGGGRVSQEVFQKLRTGVTPGAKDDEDTFYWWVGKTIWLDNEDFGYPVPIEALMCDPVLGLQVKEE